MNSTKLILTILVCSLLYAAPVVAQEPQSARPSRNTSSQEAPVSLDSETKVNGARSRKNVSSKAAKSAGFNFFDTRTPGRIAKFGNFGFLINSVITEDASGRIGIGTTTPGSALTVAGQIETKSGGIKFPNGSVQTTAFSRVIHDTTLAGNGTEESPLGVNIPALNFLSNVATNGTLAGNGTSAAPLRIALPLALSGSVIGQLLAVTNSHSEGVGLSATGFVGIQGIGAENGGYGVVASGGNIINAEGGPGLSAVGGSSNSGVGGKGVIATGGFCNICNGGTGVSAYGGKSNSGSGGVGVFAVGGESIYSIAGGVGIIAFPGAGSTGSGVAGVFGGSVLVSGNANVTGNLSKGGGSFKIDHPLDPANKYLYHSFVESPDMKNIYDGNVTTDANGDATVTLPDYFEALNRDFRYQLTVIGQFARAIVASKINGNTFTIKTDRPGVEVSWQVTGIRQDAYANKHRIPIEEEKPERERGYYLHPQVFDQPEEKSLEWARNPEMMKQIKSRRQEAELRMRDIKNDR